MFNLTWAKRAQNTGTRTLKRNEAQSNQIIEKI